METLGNHLKNTRCSKIREVDEKGSPPHRGINKDDKAMFTIVPTCSSVFSGLWAPVVFIFEMNIRILALTGPDWS